MYGNGQMNTNYGPMSLGGRDAEQQEKYAEHVKMEQMHRDSVMRQGALGGGLIRAKDINPQSPLETAMNSVDNSIGDAFAALERLSERLHIVLQPESNAACSGMAGDSASAPPRSPLVSRLHGMRVQMEVLIARINGVNSRLDA